MKIAVWSVIFIILITVAPLGDPASSAEHEQEAETCAGPVYQAKEVTRRAKITHIGEPAYTEKARANGVRGTVILSAVLCRTGKVTDIQVIEGLPDGLTEAAVESTRRIEFEPAEKDGVKVSQFIRRECRFDVF